MRDQSAIHICAEKTQPATCWVDTHSGEPIHLGFAPDDLLWTQCCRMQRAASGCVVQSRYDGPLIWCAPGHGCRDPALIAAMKARAFANRSAGQRRRHNRVHGLEPLPETSDDRILRRATGIPLIRIDT